MTSIPSPSIITSCGEPTVSTHSTVVESRGMASRWRRAKASIPSMNDSSEPVETSRTRRPLTGSSRSASARPTRTATPVRLSLAPGTTPRAPTSANTAMLPSPSSAPARSRPARPRTAPAATRAGPASTGAIRGGDVSERSSRPGATRAIIGSTPGWKSRPEWAASWWATITRVRSASRSPASATTFQVVREGSRRRQRKAPEPMSSQTAHAPAAPSAAPRARPARPPLSAASPPASAAAAGSPSGHQ